MITPPPDEREQAFEALLPIAAKTQEALEHVQDVLDDEQRLTSPLRSQFHPAQRAALLGTSRFAYTVREWGGMLDAVGGTFHLSTETQESQNIYMWLLADRYVLRIKHDLEDVVNPGAATLFSLAPQEEPVVVFLTWDTAPDQEIRNACFATLDQPAWTITLDELVDAGSAPAVVHPARPQIVVRSKRRLESDKMLHQS
jgi:hypothetical protein